MGESSVGAKSLGTLVAATAAAGLPAGGAAAQNHAPFLPTTTVTVEGGVAFSNYWATTFPGSPAGLLPGLPSDKTGFPPVASGPLQSKHNLGGYGSFSIGRDIDATLDWRFSAAFFDFGTTTSSADASQQFVNTIGPAFFGTNTASIIETDRFAFQTFDFDLGKRWTQQSIQFRAFAGLRGLHTNDYFHVATTNDKIGFFDTEKSVLSSGTSGFSGVGPRIGFDFSTGSTFGFIGSASAAAIGGIRNSQFVQGTFFDGVPSDSSALSSDVFRWVGNLEAMLGVRWQFAPNGQIAVGYKVDQWYHLRESFDFAGYNNKQDVVTQTPFLRVTLQY